MNVMGKIRVGNKKNAVLNGEWGGHVRRFGKKLTAGYRRNESKQEIKIQLNETTDTKE